jgi:hypothetical protein
MPHKVGSSLKICFIMIRRDVSKAGMPALQ